MQKSGIKATVINQPKNLMTVSGLQNMAFLKKLGKKYIWKRIYYERLTDPIHLNIISLFVAIFGNFQLKVDYDLILRHHHAYSILKCADEATRLGIKVVTLIEFGVAAVRPVLSSNFPPMPEFGGNAVVYFDPGSPRDLVEKLASIIDNQEFMKMLSDKATERAAIYDWKNSATATWNAINRLRRCHGFGIVQ